MATADTTTLTAAQVHPVLGRFSLAITPHIPPYKETMRWDTIAAQICEKVGEDIPIDLSPAETLVALKAIEVAVNSDVLSHADYEVGMYLLNRLPEAMVGDDRIHAAVDVLARLAWAIDHLEEHGINTDEVVPVLRRVRFDARILMPEHAVIVEKRREPLGGPTVGEVEAVEKAFAKVGLSKAAAHEAVGYVPYVPENAEA